MPAHRTPPGLKTKLGPLRLADGAEARDAALGGVGLDFSAIPPVLDDAGRTAWEHLRVTFADDPCRFREADRHVVAAFCDAVAQHECAARELRGSGLMVEGRSAPDRERTVRNPAWGMYRDAANLIRQLARELALSPGARKTQGITDPDPRDRSERLLDGPYGA